MTNDPIRGDRLSAAIALAAKAHAGADYNDRDPYVFHPIRVMFRVPVEARVVAVLHDLVEDTEEDAPEWLTHDERKALDLLTHTDDEDTYEEYIERIAMAEGKAGFLARQVKVADSSDHLANGSKPHLETRYRWVLGRLGPLLSKSENPPSSNSRTSSSKEEDESISDSPRSLSADETLARAYDKYVADGPHRASLKAHRKVAEELAGCPPSRRDQKTFGSEPEPEEVQGASEGLKRKEVVDPVRSSKIDKTPDPVLSDRFEEAMSYALELHRHQARKGTHIPYMAHLLQVSGIVLEAGGDEEQAIAALLHDAIEDAPKGEADAVRASIEERFGEEVLALVEACTDADVKPKPPWKERKESYLRHLPESDPEALLVSAADKLHNARAILRDLEIHGDSLWERFNAEKEDTLWYYRRLKEIYLTIGGVPLAEELDASVSAIERLAE